ncbi:hypothetical protein Nepgr_003822 [Nepenthes gracilis]|uniref:Uncharacterized protein n=1 Tax=Nepenthes gracilis TaxID=150966 RepID=A0AAD3S0C1_NEPGR|nr:hypothetical protein Nepgr_003822 [Nepenthes gracilis]
MNAVLKFKLNSVKNMGEWVRLRQSICNPNVSADRNAILNVWRRLPSKASVLRDECVLLSNFLHLRSHLLFPQLELLVLFNSVLGNFTGSSLQVQWIKSSTFLRLTSTQTSGNLGYEPSK